MSFVCEYPLVQEIEKIESGALFFVRIENFWLNSDIKNNDQDSLQKSLLKLQKELDDKLDAKLFDCSDGSLFILCKSFLNNDLLDGIVNTIFRIFDGSFVPSIGYTKFENKDDESPGKVIHRAVCANFFTNTKTLSVLDYTDCKERVQEFKDSSQNSATLYNALINDQLDFFFQPVFNSDDASVIFYEILLRVKNRTAIEDLIISAEKTGLITKIDEFVAKKSIKMIENNQDLIVSINISAFSINNPYSAKKIVSLFKAVPQLAKRIIIEITENHILNDYSRVFDFIFKIKSVGCKIAIDDFGESLHLPFLKLEKLAIDFIKLDSSFAKEINKNKNALLFVETIAKIAQNSGIKVIAEFVENEAMLKTFKEIGVFYMQGNYFAAASPKIYNHIKPL